MKWRINGMKKETTNNIILGFMILGLVLIMLIWLYYHGGIHLAY